MAAGATYSRDRRDDTIGRTPHAARKCLCAMILEDLVAGGVRPTPAPRREGAGLASYDLLTRRRVIAGFGGIAIQQPILKIPLGCTPQPYGRIDLWLVADFPLRFVAAERTVLGKEIAPTSIQRRIDTQRPTSELA